MCVYVVHQSERSARTLLAHHKEVNPNWPGGAECLNATSQGLRVLVNRRYH